MVELGVQGPLTVLKGRSEGSPSKKNGTTDNSDSTSKTEGTQTTQDTTEGRAEPDKGTSTQKQAPKKSATEESFLEDLDPSTLPAELQPHYQKLEKDYKTAYTKKTQALAKDRQKIEAYDAFFSNPAESLNRTAQQYGYKMVPISQANQQVTDNGQGFGDWQPQSWDEVVQRIGPVLLKQFEQQFMPKLQPVFDSLQRVTSDNIEKQLTEIDKDWKLYEDEMTENLKMHPTLAKDVAKLYRISVPEDVLKSKYTQQALKRFEDKAASAKVQGKSSVQSSQPIQNKKMSFQESIEWAKRQLAEQGK